MNKPALSNADISKIINSNTIQEAIKAKNSNKVMHEKHKKNPLKNKKEMAKLNPLSITIKKQAEESQKKNIS